MSSKDLIANLIMKVDDFIAPIQQARSALSGFEGSAVNSMSHIKGAMDALSVSSVVDAKNSIVDVGNKWNSFLSNTNGAESYAAATKDLYSTIGASVGLLGDAKVSLDRVKDSTANMASANRAAVPALTELTATADQQKGSLASLAQFVSGNLPAAYVAYKLVGEEVIEASSRHVTSNSALMVSLTAVSGSVSKAAKTLTEEYFGGVKASLNATLEFATGFGSITEIVDYSAATLTSWANTATVAIDAASKKAREAGLIFGTALAIWHGEQDASGFYEQGAALNAMADATAVVIEKQQLLRDALAVINGAADKAANAQKQSSEVARIGTIQTVEALDAELLAMRLCDCPGTINDDRCREDQHFAWAVRSQARHHGSKRNRTGIRTGNRGGSPAGRTAKRTG